MTQFLRPRRLVRGVLSLPLTAGLLLAQGPTPSPAPTPTDLVVKCIENAAAVCVQCLADRPWYAEGLCYSKYAADGILCTPATLLKLMMS
ncbi:MAG: hypothetical protein RI891_117 [Gemmatimonadota bacterium]